MRNWKNYVRWLFFGLFLFIIAQGKMVLWLIIFAASLPLAYYFGRLYCGYVCPMNTVMKLSEKMSGKMKWIPKEAPRWLSSGRMPWVFLFLSLGWMVFSRTVLGKNPPVLLIWLLLSVVSTLFYKPSVFHNLICPFGVLQKAFSRKPYLAYKVVESQCIGCKKCEKVCPSASIEVLKANNKACITTSLCLQCGNCKQVCPKDTIFYQKR